MVQTVSIKSGEKRLRIGIPRAFYYFSYPKLWETFFTEIGMEVVVSDISTKKTVDIAALETENEHCLPHKLFDGHVLSIIDKVDLVFIPRALSMVKDHISCTKFGALPDASRAGVASDTQVLSIEINENREPLKKTLVKLGRELGIGKGVAKRAVEKAYTAMTRHNEKLSEKISKLPQEGRILLLGHPYTLNDAFIAETIKRKLRSMKVPTELFNFGVEHTAPSHIRWCTFNKMYEKVKTLDPSMYMGIVHISTFNCGSDTALIDGYRHLCAEREIPYMVLMMDDHSGQAGVETRLEAFIDSIEWKKRRDQNSGH